MRISCLLLLILVFICAPLGASVPEDFDKVKTGQTYRCFEAELNGKPCTLRVKVVSKDDRGWGGQLQVYDGEKKLLWKGPETKDPARIDEPLAVGSFLGFSWPQLAADIDLDGKTELLISAPQSDVRPTTYKISRWDGKKFVPLRMGQIMEVSDGRFRWVQTEDYEGVWLDNIVFLPSERLFRADCISVRGGEYKSGAVELKAVPEGFERIRWLKPLRALE